MGLWFIFMINQNCPLILHDLYYYDIVSAFPTIMSAQNYDFGNVDLNNKEERNIFIGKEQLKNQNLSSFLNESVKDLTDFYLQYNEINDDDVIFRQKDGFIITKMLAKNDLYIEMKLRHMLTLLFIDINRQSMIYFDENNNIEIKGVRHYYDALKPIYEKFFNLDFYNKKTLSLQLKDIKDSIILSKDKYLFGINDDDIKYTFILKNQKQIKTYDVDFVDIDEIDKNKYFNYYFKPFLDAIFIEEFYEQH